MRSKHFKDNIDNNAIQVARQSPNYSKINHSSVKNHPSFSAVSQMTLREFCSHQVDLFDDCDSSQDENLFDWMGAILRCIDPVFYA